MFGQEEHNETRKHRSSEIGESGEAAAAEYLRIRGYRIVAMNFSAPIGRTRKGVILKGEIDIIAITDDTICFVEVKTRTNTKYAPELSVGRRKQRQISRTGEAYLAHFDISDFDIRYDVISVLFKGTRAPEVRHLPGYWKPDDFNRRRIFRSR